MTDRRVVMALSRVIREYMLADPFVCFVCRERIEGRSVHTKWVGIVHHDGRCWDIAKEAMYGRSPTDRRRRARRNQGEARAWIAAQWPPAARQGAASPRP